MRVASVAAASGLKKCVAPRREKVHRVQAEGLIRELPLRVVVPSRLACLYFVKLLPCFHLLADPVTS